MAKAPLCVVPGVYICMLSLSRFSPIFAHFWTKNWRLCWLQIHIVIIFSVQYKSQLPIFLQLFRRKYLKNITSVPDQWKLNEWQGNSLIFCSLRALQSFQDGWCRVARWFVFKPKIPIGVNFGRSCNGKSWRVLWPFSLFYGHCKCLMAIWYILWSFGLFFPVLVFCTKKNLATLGWCEAAASQGFLQQFMQSSTLTAGW
jgi:hypothetical protein